jgi:hypothetical protein
VARNDERGPEESIQRAQYWEAPLAFEHGQLLSQREDFQGRVAATAEEDSDGSNEGEDGFEHEITLVTRRNNGVPSGADSTLQTADFKSS